MPQKQLLRLAIQVEEGEFDEGELFRDEIVASEMLTML